MSESTIHYNVSTPVRDEIATALGAGAEDTVSFERQEDIIDHRLMGGCSITVIGAGGIGSPTAQELAHLGAKDISVFDYDSVEAHNIPTQRYRIQDVGRRKVDALRDIIISAVGTAIMTHAELYTHQPLGRIVISAVDSMSARRTIWNQVKQQMKNPQTEAGNVEFYIEARMAAEFARIFTVTYQEVYPAPASAYEDHLVSEVSQYEDTLYSDDEALDVPCTAKATTYCCSMIASLITNQVKRFVTGQETHREIIFDFVTMVFQAIRPR